MSVGPLFFVSLAAAVHGTEVLTEVRWNWDWPTWATALLGAAAVAWVAGIYAKELRFVSPRVRFLLALLRVVAVGIVLLMLAQPTIERRRVVPPRLAVLLDDSASMETRDVSAVDLAEAQGAAAKATRLEAWEHILSTGEHPLLDVLRSRYEVDLVRFATDAKAVTSLTDDAPKESRSATHLGDALDFAIRHLPGPRPAAIVVMTDGINTAGAPLADAAARARTLGVPVYAIALGSDRPRPDISLDDVLVEDVVFPGDRLQIEATLRATGYSGQPSRVTLKRSGADGILAETAVTLPADGQSQTVRLALRPTVPGPMRVQLEVAAQADEDDTTNNWAEVTIDVRDRPIRALLVDSTPSFEFRALKSLLERDPAIDLNVWLQDADQDYASVDDAAIREFPATEAELLEYDVLLLSDVDPRLLPRQTWVLLQRFATMHGGGVVLIAGERFVPQAFANIEPMEALLPIDSRSADALRGNEFPPAGVRITPTPLGLQDPSLQLGETIEASASIWSDLPPVRWILKGVRPKPGVQVLAVGMSVDNQASEPTPAIMRHYVGAGEVLMHATDETWRWRWRNDDRYFARYWGQTVRRLARGRILRGDGSLATNHDQYRLGIPVIVRARLGPSFAMDGDALNIELSGDATLTRQIRLPRKGVYAQLFQATLRDLPADRYVARVVAPGGSAAPLTAEFVVAAPPGELAQLVVNTSGLGEAARMTGGKLYTAKTAGRLREDLPPPKPTAVEQLPDEPLWNSHWFLVALCLTLGVEWLARRRAGML